ncbi:MAG: peptidylprolyl isomerase [Saprospirales bacterium]|nr:peptidylprolyl isomerase [Saprospirales bacterium]
MVIMVALGLGGFILMSGTKNQGFLSSDRTIMAEVADKKIDINEFNNLEQTVYGNSSGDPYARRNALWNYYMEKILLEKEAEAIGIGVGKDELLDLQFGTNLSPVISRNLQDPNTGQVDRNRLLQFKTAIENNTLEASIRPFWAYQEKDIVRERLKEKMINMISKGLYIPTWQAEMIANEQNSKVDFVYARIPFDVVPTDDVALSDADYKDYLKGHASEFVQKEQVRRLEYVIFDVLPSAADSQAILQQMVDLSESFSRTEDDSLFIQNNFGTIDGAYYKKSELASTIADTVFKVLPETVIGPYLELDSYRSVKVLDRKVLPDSVRSRHILIRADMTNQQEVQQAALTLDSLRVLIKSGVQTFEELATQFGQDGTAAKGGDLGYAAPSQMVKPFNDLIFFQAKPDSLYIIGTQFGVHLVEVTGKQFITNEEGVRLGYISQQIIPSEGTERQIEQDAILLATENNTLEDLHKALAGRTDLSFEISGPLPRSGYSIPVLGSGQSVRNIVRWAFGNDPSYGAPEVGDICKDVFAIQQPDKFYTDKFVIAGLKSIQKPGKPNMEAVKNDIEPAVLNKKKAEMIIAQLGSPSSVQDAASKYGVAVDTARGAAFSNGLIPEIGNEPKVVAMAFKLDLNSTSSPIEGSSGVFVIMPVLKPAVPSAPNLQLTRRTTATTLRSQVQGRLVTFLKEKEGVEDMRAKFY